MSAEPSNEDLQALADQVNEAFAEADVTDAVDAANQAAQDAADAAQDAADAAQEAADAGQVSAQ